MSQLVFTLGIAAALLAMMPPIASASDDEHRRTLSVSATGEAEAEPDMAVMTTGVVTTGATARDALSSNNEAMGNVIDGLKALGIASRDLQTQGFSIQPRFNRSKSSRSSGPEISGFEVRNSVQVLIRDVDQLGSVIDKAASLGANQFGGVNFVVSKAETLRDAAREEAVDNARRRAETYARAAGVKLGRVLSIAEGGSSGPVRQFRSARAMAAEAVPIEGGSETLRVSVSVVWELED